VMFWNKIIASAAPVVNIPKQYWDVMKLSQAEQKLWKIAMNDEIKSLMECKVWDLVALPLGHVPIKGRWVYAVKGDGHKKAHFIAKGFTQIYRIDFEETFLLVVRFEIVHLLLSIAALEDWDIEALDVKMAFLFGELDKEIYMEQLEGFIKKSQEKNFVTYSRPYTDSSKPHYNGSRLYMIPLSRWDLFILLQILVFIFTSMARSLSF
jgi:hypothetical protein